MRPALSPCLCSAFNCIRSKQSFCGSQISWIPTRFLILESPKLRLERRKRSNVSAGRLTGVRAPLRASDLSPDTQRSPQCMPLIVFRGPLQSKSCGWRHTLQRLRCRAASRPGPPGEPLLGHDIHLYARKHSFQSAGDVGGSILWPTHVLCASHLCIRNFHHRELTNARKRSTLSGD